MNRMQKMAWLIVINMGSGLILSAIAVAVGIIFGLIESLTYIIEYGKDNKQPEGGAA